MTCFWDGLIAGLGQRRIHEVLALKSKRGRPIKPVQFVEALQKKNRRTIDVAWRTCCAAGAFGDTNPGDENARRGSVTQLDRSLLDANFRAVKELDARAIWHGYLSSSMDPFMLLVCQLFRVKIAYDFNGARIIYTVKDATTTLHFKCNRTHFWFAG